jgi:hypothetical protein
VILELRYIAGQECCAHYAFARNLVFVISMEIYVISGSRRKVDEMCFKSASYRNLRFFLRAKRAKIVFFFLLCSPDVTISYSLS